MEPGIFYSVGVGPGDPKLLTLLAVETIQRCPVIALPDSGASENAARSIAAQWLQNKEILLCEMPMTRNPEKLRAARQSSVELLASYLSAGKDIAFLTLGDPAIYATPMYLHTQLKKMGFKTRMIPGVPSFCAAAAALDVPLCEGGEMLHIVPASYADTAQALGMEGTKVLMKAGKSIGEVKAQIDPAAMCAMAAERCGMAGEKLHPTLDTLGLDASYFSVVLVRDKKPKTEETHD